MTHASSNATSHPVRLGVGVASLAVAALLLIGFKAPDDAGLATAGGRTGGSTGGSGSNGGTGSSGGSNSGSTGTTGGTGSSGSDGSASTGGGSATTGGSSTTSGTIDGMVVNTHYGPVQVEITVANGKVTAASAIELPSGGRSGAISGYAAPILSDEAVTAQNANIDLVSGATYTSEAYAQSLQAALDQAGL